MTMMAIGDSLYNGVRSLTINQTLAYWSVPAQVARALNIPFAIPDYPRNVVIDMERWLGMLPIISRVADDLASNINFWLTQPTTSSGAAEFDNIAIASTTIEDMWQRTWKTADNDIKQLQASFGTHLASFGAPLDKLFFDFNTRFLLNPTGNPDTPAESPLEIVRRRRPERLLVFIGSNNGLWEICFNAIPKNAFGAADFTDLQKFMDQLISLPPEIKHIYINTLPPLSTVSNLMPIPDDAIETRPGAGALFANYENRFGFGYGTYDSEGMTAVNARVASVNQAMMTAAAADARIHVVRTDKLLIAYDAKHDPEAKSIKTPYGDGSLTFTNVMTEAKPWPLEPAFKTGGIQGLDGMHPTIVGYTAIAQLVLDAIETHEGIPQPVLDFSISDRADTLLTSTPRIWAELLWLWRDIRRAEADGTSLLNTIEHVQLKSFMQMLQFKTN